MLVICAAALCAACPFAPRNTAGDEQNLAGRNAAAQGELGGDAAPLSAAAEAERGAEAAGEPGAAEVREAPPPAFPPYAGHADDDVPVAVPIEGIERLDYYFGKLTLAELDRPRAIARASHWGDSVIGGDGLTERVRQRLQQRFGDAGHGFHALGRYSRWYNHRGVWFKERRAWKTCLIIFKCEKDGRYGYGGVTSTSHGRAQSTWRTVPEEFGQRVSRFELWYQKRPDGGGFEIRVDGEVARVVDARAATVSDAVEQVSLEDGQHEIDVTALPTGVARGYGVVLERATAGAVWDELSMIGAFTQRLDYQDAEHVAGQVRQRDVDLLVFMFGGNDLSRESSDLKRTTEPYEAEYARVLRKLRAGKPEASCLIMSLTDHARRVNGAIVTRPMVARLVEAQRRVARAEGCGFFDTYAAMGGAGAVARGRKSKPPLAAPDLGHPTRAGQQRVAELLYAALMQGYASYRRRQVGQPLPALEIAMDPAQGAAR